MKEKLAKTIQELRFVLRLREKALGSEIHPRFLTRLDARIETLSEQAELDQAQMDWMIDHNEDATLEGR